MSIEKCEKLSRTVFKTTKWSYVCSPLNISFAAVSLQIERILEDFNILSLMTNVTIWGIFILADQFEFYLFTNKLWGTAAGEKVNYQIKIPHCTKHNFIIQVLMY